jgi:hypothetical protein
MVELPPLLERVTVLPLTALPLAFLAVTVMVDVVEPSAGTDVRLGATVDVLALTVLTTRLKVEELRVLEQSPAVPVARVPRPVVVPEGVEVVVLMVRVMLTETLTAFAVKLGLLQVTPLGREPLGAKDALAPDGSEPVVLRAAVQLFAPGPPAVLKTTVTG